MEAVDHAVPKEFTWRGLAFELEDQSEAEPDVGLGAGLEYVHRLEGGRYIAVWTHDGGVQWRAQIDSDGVADPLADGCGATREAALAQMLGDVAELKRIIADFESRLAP